MDRLPKMSNLTSKNKMWVVFSYGGVVQSLRGGLLAEVLLKELVDGNIRSNTHIARIPVRDLDFVKIGTVWKNNLYVFDMFENIKEKQFSFNFEKYSPKIVSLRKTQLYKYRHFDRLDTIAHEHFKNSNYLSLQSVLGITVLIPVLEVLTSIILPDNKEIREKLLLKDINTVLKEYVKESYIDNSKYIIKPYITHFERTLLFLAYLYNNNISKQRISKIFASMLVTHYNRFSNTPLPYKHPEILPFQPSSLLIQAKWRHIDRSTIVIDRITGIADETDYDVILKQDIYNEYETKEGNRYKQYFYKSIQQQLEESDMLQDKNPHYKNGHVYTSTKVQRIGKLKRITIDKSIKKREKTAKLCFQGDQKTNILSSAEKSNKNSSKDVTQIKVGDTYDKEIETEIPLFDQIVFYLEQLKKNKRIDTFCYILESGKEVDKKSYCQCNIANIRKVKERTWFRRKYKGKYRNRNFLLIKIIVREKSIYLLEIERIKQGEHYAGILFESISLDKELIQSLLQEIGKNKGRYRNKTKNSKKKFLPISEYQIYAHYKKTNYICKALEKVFDDLDCTHSL